jgi:hypothetical protein
VAAVTGGIVAFVLLRTSGGDGDGYSPLPYLPRQRNSSAQAAFSQDLHPLLLPREAAALGLAADADVIVVGAGVAGLRAAAVLAAEGLRVLILEARVSEAGGAGCRQESTVFSLRSAARRVRAAVSVASCQLQLPSLPSPPNHSRPSTHAHTHEPTEARAHSRRFRPVLPRTSMQDRVGGRIRSEPFGGMTAELGAQFILGSESSIDGGGPGNPLTMVRWAVRGGVVARGVTSEGACSGTADWRQLWCCLLLTQDSSSNPCLPATALHCPAAAAGQCDRAHSGGCQQQHSHEPHVRPGRRPAQRGSGDKPGALER